MCEEAPFAHAALCRVCKCPHRSGVATRSTNCAGGHAVHEECFTEASLLEGVDCPVCLVEIEPCGICFAPLHNGATIRTLKCTAGHRFHKECIAQNTNHGFEIPARDTQICQGSSCPACREQLPELAQDRLAFLQRNPPTVDLTGDEARGIGGVDLEPRWEDRPISPVREELATVTTAFLEEWSMDVEAGLEERDHLAHGRRAGFREEHARFTPTRGQVLRRVRLAIRRGESEEDKG